MKTFGKENLDVLQNIEFGIVEVYRADLALIDLDVKDALDALIRQYRALEDRRTVPAADLHEKGQRVFESIQRICEWRLGRTPLNGRAEPHDPERISVSELLVSLKEIQKSVPRWSKQGGRQGYLKFVSQYIH
jgi:hypothetical protein